MTSPTRESETCFNSAPSSAFPLVTLLLSAAVGAAWLLPSAATGLQYDRAALAAGQGWRIFTCHWTHFSLDHLLWDLATSGRWDQAREVYRWYMPLLHLDTHVKLVQYIKLANSECGFGTETVRSPRLPITGGERDEVLAVIRRGIASRPGR